MLNCKKLPMEDVGVEDFLKRWPLSFRTALEKWEYAVGVDFVIIAMSADCNPGVN